MQGAKERYYGDPELRTQYRKRKYRENLRQQKKQTERNNSQILNKKENVKKIPYRNDNIRKDKSKEKPELNRKSEKRKYEEIPEPKKKPKENRKKNHKKNKNV